MKVGIMSMQRIINYGSFLQAYSLKKNIEALGGEVEFVDYQVEPVLVKDDVINSDKISQYVNKILDRIIPPIKLPKKKMQSYWRAYHKVDNNYMNEMLPQLGVTGQMNYRPELDLLVIGSDEVFNCLQPNPAVGYSKELFGANNRAKKVISYAASFGNTKEEGLKKYGIYEEIKDLVMKFDGLSARDTNTYEILSKMTDKKIIKNVDPVFLYDYDEETRIEVPIDNYIVVYAYAKRISKKEARAIKRFAKKYNKKIVCLCAPQEYLEGYVALNPFEILAYIRNADYVITDTFHGTVFSIKNNRKFATFIRGGYETVYGNNKKLYDLLKTFGLESRSVDYVENLEQILLAEIDFQKVNMQIESERRKAISYFKSFMEE